MSVAVITANFGAFDAPRGAVVQEGYEDADWYAFTDNIESVAAPWPDPWECVGVATDPPREDCRLAAKPYKMIPWTMLALASGRSFRMSHRWIVWLDANMEVTSPQFLHEALASAACSGAPLATWRHPRRRRIWDEAMASLRDAPAKYDHRLIEQVEEYRRLGFRDDAGLWACGTLVWNMENPQTRRLGNAWLAECERWSIQDQLSLPFVSWALDVPVHRFPVRQVDGYERFVPDERAGYCFNEWMRIHDHLRND